MTASRQQILELRLPQSSSFDTYACSTNDAPLLKALESFSEGRADEPLWLIWGGRHVGKTHLGQAVCQSAAAKPGVYLPSALLRTEGPELLKGLTREPGLLVIDDVHRLWPDSVWQHALFVLINEARESRVRLLFLADRLPSDMILPDLRSRLLSGVVWKLNRPSDEQLYEIWKIGARSRGMHLSHQVLVYLLHHGPRDPAMVLQLIEQMDHQALASHQSLTIPFARKFLAC